MSVNYTVKSLNLSDNQKRKIAQAVKNKASTTIRLSTGNYDGNDKIRLTKQQLNKINKAKGKTVGTDLKLSKTQLQKQGGLVLPTTTKTQVKRAKGLVLPGTTPRIPPPYYGQWPSNH